MIGYTPLSKKDAFFVCANSGYGFVSYFDELFENCTRLYILKGGPGTGKSGFMEQVAKAAAARGLAVSRILCSSDPRSLDGIYIPALHLGIADGTAPHLLEPTLPGAREQLLDPGAFWDPCALLAQRAEIEELNSQKKAHYRSALALIEGAKNTALCQQSILSAHQDTGKTARLLKKLHTGAVFQKGKIQNRFLSAIGMEGAVTLDTCVKQSEKIYTFSPYFGQEHLLMNSLLALFLEKEGALILFKDPISLLPEGIYLEKEGLFFRCGRAVGCEKEKIIDSKKTLTPLSKEDKKQLRALEKQQQQLIDSSVLFLSKMKDCHFKLETIYGAAMDFQALEGYKDSFIQKIFP